MLICENLHRVTTVPINKDPESTELSRPDEASCSANQHECCPTSPTADLNFLRYVLSVTLYAFMQEN